MRNKAVAYAMDFASFLIESGIEPTNIILFGSAVSGSLDKDSDIDIIVVSKSFRRKNLSFETPHPLIFSDHAQFPA